MTKSKADTMAETEADDPTRFMPDDLVQVNMAGEGEPSQWEPASVVVAMHKAYAASEYDVVFASGIQARVNQDRLIPA